MSADDFISAQSLRWQIEVKRKTSTPDGMGGEVVTYVTRCRPRADVRQVTGREQIRSGQLTPSHSIEVRMRHREDIQPSDLIHWQGVDYDIQDISPMGRNRSLRILASLPAPRNT